MLRSIPATAYERPRDRGASLRRGSGHVPAAGRPGRAAAAADERPGRRRRRGGRRGRHPLRPADREADRARGDPRRGDRPSRARRSPRPRSAASSRTCRSCAGSSRIPRSAPATRPPTSSRASRRCSAPPARVARRALAPAVPAQPPAPVAAPPPLDEPDASHTRGAARRADEITAPMPGTVIRVLVAPGDEVEARAHARRRRGDEDGDAARRAAGGHRPRGPRRRGRDGGRGAVLVELED